MRINNEYDVAIVGAGVTGLTAAIRLVEIAQQQQKPIPRVVVLEADQEPGGRMRSQTLSNGLSINIGAHWGHGGLNNQFFRWAINRYDLTACPLDTAETRMTFSDHSCLDKGFMDHAMTRITTAWECFKRRQADQGDRSDLSLTSLVRKIDDLSTSLFAQYKSAVWMGVHDPAEVSMREFIEDPNGSGGLVIDGGNDVIIRSMIGELAQRNISVVMGSTVLSALHEPDGSSVHLRVRDEEYSDYKASQCLITTSVGVLKASAIDFDPPVFSALRPVLADLSMAQFNKVIVPLKTDFMKASGVEVDTHIAVLYSDHPNPYLVHMNPSGKPIATLFVSDKESRYVERLNQSDLLHWTRSVLTRVTPLQDFESHLDGDIVATKWGENPLVRGGYSILRPGGLRHDPISSGRITFAGEAFCASQEHSPSQVEGAYHSGRMAAESIFPKLG
ncbi:MAG: FAD-dependent oxidoreductase [Alphaproteobacteria bacterium]|nr:FAD-dependent oxidoreductase [Alphaproteobacteria bacterium]